MSDEEQRVKKEVQEWLDIANKLPTYEDVKGSLPLVFRSRSLELVEEWAKKKGASDE